MNANTTKFNPKTANYAELEANGFTGVVTKVGARRAEFEFKNATTGKLVQRTFLRGMFVDLENAFIATKAPLAVLIENGFEGTVTELGKFGGKPSTLTFTKGAVTATRQFPYGMCAELENKFEDEHFDPTRATFEKLVANGFRGRVLELGTGPVVGAPKGKPTKLEFKNQTSGVTVVRFFPRGTCKGLEDGYQQRQGVRMRARPVIRTR